MKRRIEAALRKLVPAFIRTPTGNYDDDVVIRIWWIATSLTALFTLLVSLVLYVAGVPVLGLLMLIHSGFWLMCLLIYAVVRKGIHWFGLTTHSFCVVIAFVYSILVGDPRISSGFLVTGFIGPLYALIWSNRRRALVLFIVYSLTAILSPLMRRFVPPVTGDYPGISEVLFVVALLACAIASFLALLFFVLERTRLLKLLHNEQEKSERLLLNILPKPIADILRNENRVIADHYEGASIFFADIVGFTPMSSKMSPREVVALLNEVFCYFDSLVEKYDLEKIKTIGDCYMVASGLPQPRSDHAHALVAMALEARDYFLNRSFPGGRNLSFRIGINSGPVVAGVIGIKRFIYDLWGDAVNTASRMESHGKPNVIQITEATYELVRNAYICEPQEAILVKGKGKMPVWYVTGRR